jgi:glutamate-1-semialdehyde 2,1-aminomutase
MIRQSSLTLASWFGFVGQALWHFIGYWTTGTRLKRADDRLRLRGEWIRRFLVRMGPLYVKAGQIMATRSDLIPADLVKVLQTLQDDVPGMPEADLRKILAEEYGDPSRHFSSFVYQPIASASIAQVHEAWLIDGRKVAVKVVRRGTTERLRANIGMLRSAARLACLFSRQLNELNVVQRVDELGKLLLEQADMRREGRNQKLVRENFSSHPFVTVPAVIDEVSTSKVLVSEFVDAIRGKDFLKSDLARDKLAARFQDTIYTMLYMHGVCHGDPHPGNVFFKKDGGIVFVDFGITVFLTEDEKWGLSSFYYACIRKEWRIAAERFTRHFVVGGRPPEEPALREAYYSELEAVLKLHFDVRNNRWSTISYFGDVNAVIKRHGLRYTTSFTKVELVFLSCEGFASQIDPDIDIWGNARKFTDRFSPYMSDAVRSHFDEYFSEALPTSWRLKKEAGRHLIAPTHIDRYFFPSTYPLFIKKAEGCMLTDHDGNTFIDLAGGYGPHLLGYGHPVQREAVISAIEAGGINALANTAEIELADLIVEALPSAEKLVFSNSGTEAVLHAIRVCRGYRRRDRVAKFEGQYHGFSDQGMVSSWFRFTGDKEEPKAIHGSLGTQNAVVSDTLVLQFGSPRSLEVLRERADELACVVMEPMPSMLAAVDTEFLAAVRAICTETDVPLVFDEVVTGFRVDYGGVQTLSGISPDVTCLGKVIGGGLPCGAMAGREDIVQVARTTGDPFRDYETRTFLGGTMAGNSISCAAGAAVLTYLRDNRHLYDELQRKTEWLRDQMSAVAEANGIKCQITANRSIFSITFNHRKSKYYRDKLSGSNFKANLSLAYYMRKHRVYMPELHTMILSMAHEQEHLQTICDAFDASLKEMIADNFFVN